MQTIERGFSLRTIESSLLVLELKISVLGNEFMRMNHSSCREVIVKCISLVCLCFC